MASLLWQQASEPRVALPISMLRMNCRPRLRRWAAASHSWIPAWKVAVIALVSTSSTRFKPFISITVPVDAGQGVSEWKLPMARTGLG